MSFGPPGLPAASREPTAEECAAMERDGYLVVRGFFGAAQTGEMLRWAGELEAAPEVSGRHWVYHEDSLTEPGRRLIQRIENFCPFHDGFDRLIRHGALARWAGALMGGPVVLFKEKINFKMPGGPGTRLRSCDPSPNRLSRAVQARSSRTGSHSGAVR